MNSDPIDDPNSLTQTAFEFLRAGVVPIVEETGGIGAGVNVKFNWHDRTFQISLNQIE